MEASSSTGGSTWNKGGSTWEEKTVNQWAFDLLKDTLLPEIQYELPTATVPMPALPKSEDLGDGERRLHVRVLSVESVKGECTYVLSRGKQRVVFEMEIKLKLEMELHVGDELKTILSGKLTVPEVTNDDIGESKMVSGCKCTCEQDGWKPFFEAASKGSWFGLKASLESLVDQTKQKWA